MKVGQSRPGFLGAQIPRLPPSYLKYLLGDCLIMSEHRICRHCGKDFESIKNSWLCSDCRVGVCAVCGKSFKRFSDYPKYEWCSKECQKKYAESLGRSTRCLFPKSVICKACGKEFIPKSSHSLYCEGPHYRPCPICNKPVEFHSLADPVVCCSKECNREKCRRTSKDRYGCEYPSQSPEIESKRSSTTFERYGDTAYARTSKFRQQYVSWSRSFCGYDSAFQSPEIRKKFRESLYERTGFYEPLQLSHVREALDEYQHDPIHAREIAIKRSETRKKCVAFDGTCLDSSYELDVYEFCKRCNIDVVRQVHRELQNSSGLHKIIYDFLIDNRLYECKGGHLLQGTWDNASVTIRDKLDSYMKNHAIVVTDFESGFSELNKPENLQIVAVDIEIFRIFNSHGDRDNSIYRDRFEYESDIWRKLQNMLNSGSTRIFLNCFIQ